MVTFPLCIYASEFGALLGLCQFKSVREAIEIVVARHAPKKQIEPSLKRKREIISAQSFPTDHADVSGWKASKVQVLHNAQTALALAMLNPGHTFPVELSAIIPTITSDIAEARMLTQTCTTAQVASIVKHAISSSSSSSSPTIPVQAVQAVQRVLNQIANSAPVHMNLTPADLDIATREAVSSINCTRGKLQEISVVQRKEIKHIQTTCRRRLQVGNHSITLFGRTDGCTEKGYPIEIKSRKNRLYKKLFDQELAQLYVYMYCMDCKSGVFMESCGDDIYEDTIEFDDAEWVYYVNQLKHPIEAIVAAVIDATPDRSRSSCFLK
jgi:hypothetical protein